MQLQKDQMVERQRTIANCLNEVKARKEQVIDLLLVIRINISYNTKTRRFQADLVSSGPASKTKNDLNEVILPNHISSIFLIFLNIFDNNNFNKILF